MKYKKHKKMYIFFAILLLIIIGLLLFLQHPLFGKAPNGERLDRIKQSINYKNNEFQNLSNTPSLTEGVSYISAIKDMLFSKVESTKPTDSIPIIKTNLNEFDSPNDYLIWFGHSSYIMQLDGKKILVDPVLTDNASPIFKTNTAFLGTNFYTADHLSHIDYLLITHDHYDHLDYSTFKSIKNKVQHIICPLGVGAHLEYWGYSKDQITELDWYETFETIDLKITATPTRHFSGRSFNRNNTLWAAYVVKSKIKTIYVGGDSGYDKHFKSIGSTYGPFDLSILENGQYDYKWKYIHMMPEEVVIAAKDLNSKAFFPVHSSKFKLANHKWNEPLEKVYTLNKDQKDLRMLHPKIGEPVFLDSLQQKFSTWWRDVK